MLATFNKDLGEIADAAIFVAGNVIQWVGSTRSIPGQYSVADTIISLSERVVIPGLVNTHHHMFQCLTRCIAQVRSATICNYTNDMEQGPWQVALTCLKDLACSYLQDTKLFGWLTTLYAAWVHLTVRCWW